MTETPTPDEIARWAALAEQATPGRWVADPRPDFRANVYAVVDDTAVSYRVAWGADDFGTDPPCEREDAEFIAAAREAVPRLLALVAAQAEQNAELQRAEAYARADWWQELGNHDASVERAENAERETETVDDLHRAALARVRQADAERNAAEQRAERAEAALSALRATDEYQRWARAVTERDAARGQVARVEALCVESDKRAQEFLGPQYVNVGRLDVRDVRAALDGTAIT